LLFSFLYMCVQVLVLGRFLIKLRIGFLEIKASQYNISCLIPYTKLDSLFKFDTLHKFEHVTSLI
jgi:hypothetical protein